MGTLKENVCPNCGASVRVLEYSKTVNCDYCGTILHVDDKGSEGSEFTNTGIKMDKHDVGPLHVGTFGFYKRIPFKIVGVIEYIDDEGWKWQEYYLNFKDGKKAWLEYDDGQYTILFNLFLDDFKIPRMMLSSLKVSGEKVKITEKGESKIVYQWGQIPFTSTPDATINYIDGIGKPSGSIYSVEYTDHEVEVFKGEKVDKKFDGQYIHLTD